MERSPHSGPAAKGFSVGERVAYCLARGSYAEYAVVPEGKLVRVPANIAVSIATTLMLQGATAHYLTHSAFKLGLGQHLPRARRRRRRRPASGPARQEKRCAASLRRSARREGGVGQGTRGRRHDTLSRRRLPRGGPAADLRQGCRCRLRFGRSRHPSEQPAIAEAARHLRQLRRQLGPAGAHRAARAGRGWLRVSHASASRRLHGVTRGDRVRAPTICSRPSRKAPSTSPSTPHCRSPRSGGRTS